MARVSRPLMTFGVKPVKPRAEECPVVTVTLPGIQCSIYWDPILSFGGKSATSTFTMNRIECCIIHKGVSIIESWSFVKINVV